MTEAALLALVRTLTYKPGAWFELGHHDGPGAGVTYAPGVGVTLWLPTRDVRDPSREYIVPRQGFIAQRDLATLDDAGACRVIRDEILVPLEHHEIDEWFCRAGQKVTLPTGH